MRHCPALRHATLTVSIMLVAAAGAAFADPFEDAPRDLRPPVPFPPTATRSGAVGGLPSATGSVPVNIRVAQAAPAPSAGIEAGDREDCADGTENSYQKIAGCSRVIADSTANAAKHAQAYRSRGNAYYDKSDYDRAIADFSEAMKLDPDIALPSFALAYNRRGLAYVEKKDYDLAIADYGEAIKLDASSAEVYKNRGSAYNIKRDYDLAIADFDQALTLDPSYALAYNSRGVAYFGKNDTDRAIADYSEALKRNPNYAIAYNNRGNAYFKKNDYDRAISDYSEAVRSNPNFAIAYNDRGFAYSRKNDLDRAIADYNEAIRLNPRLARPYRHRCNAYYSMKSYDAAIADCSEATRLDPKDDFARTTLGLANAAKRDLEAVTGSEEVFRLQNNVLKLPVLINGVRGTFIMDTGATFVSMKRAFAEKAKVQIDQDSNVKIHTANGEVDAKRGRAATVQLRSLQAKDVVVVVQTVGQSNYGEGVDGLLGLSFLSRFKISIDAQTVKIANRNAK
jgi:clan AA aspartic protease (TIGR02281 family)